MTSVELRIVRIEEQLRDLQRDVRKADDKAENARQQASGGSGGSIRGADGTLKAYTTSTITARSGTTMGSGTADLYYRAGTTLTTTTQSVTVRSQFGTSVASGVRIYVAWIDEGYEMIAADC